MPLIKSDSKQAISKNIATEIEAGKPRRQAVAIALNIARHLRDGGSVEPSEAQKSAGNYKKAHISVHGLDISVENPRGTHRRGVNQHTGRKWSVRMPGHYGYIKRTEGADGDHVDCTVGPDVHSDTVFVIDQNDIDTGKFDEHKCMIGYASEADALRAYRSSFSDGKGSDRIGHVRRMNVSQFKKWLVSDKTKEPLRRADGGRVNETLDDYTADYAVPRNDLDSIGGWDLGQPGDLGQGQKLIDETKEWKRPSPPGLDIPAEPPADWQPMGMLERAGRRLTGTMPGEERHQLWPEKMIRSAVTAPGDYLTGAENAPPPGLRREDYTDAPGAPEPSDKMIERVQDLAGLIMGGSLPSPKPGGTIGVAGKGSRHPSARAHFEPEVAVDHVRQPQTKLRSGQGDEGTGPVPLGEQSRRFGENGFEMWKNASGQLHREDGPAIVEPDGTQWWYQRGEFHREDGPAVVYPDGTQKWYQKGELHREDGPAIVYPDGTQEFWIDNKRVRSPPKKMSSDLLHSAVEEAVGKMPTAKMTGEQWLATLRNKPGIKGEELDWVGLTDFFETHSSEKLAQKEVADYLSKHKLKLSEYVDSGRDAKYTEYSTTGLDHYRELRFVVPSEFIKGTRYVSSHWGEPNVVAHTRVGDMMTLGPGGEPKKTLFVDEIQSDWHQAGREHGYLLSYKEDNELRRLDSNYDTLSPEELIRHQELTRRARIGYPGPVSAAPFMKSWPEMVIKRMLAEAAANDYDRLAWTTGKTQSERYRLSNLVSELRIEHNRNGTFSYEYQPINAIGDWVPGGSYLTSSQLAEHLGPELAERARRIEPGSHDRINTVDLQLDSEGMRKFYDEMVPKMVEKIGKPWKLRAVRAIPDIKQLEPQLKPLSTDFVLEFISPVYPRQSHEMTPIVDAVNNGATFKAAFQDLPLETIEEITRYWGKQDVSRIISEYDKQLTFIKNKFNTWLVDIPKEMKKDLAGKGFPLFQRGGIVTAPAQKDDKVEPRAAGGFVENTARMARQLRRQRPLGTTGPLMSAVGGRTDHLPLEVPQGAYVLPADHVSSLGQGNTLSGFDVLNKMFGVPTGGKLHPRPVPRRARGGDVPIMAAGGEYVVQPDVVAEIGGGSLDRGHDILDKWVTSSRKHHIATLRSLPGPERS